MDQVSALSLVRRANRSYLLTVFLLLVGGNLLVDRIGVGGNLWVSELAYFLPLPLWLAWRRRRPCRDTLRLDRLPAATRWRCLLAGALLGVGNRGLLTGLEAMTVRLLGPLPPVAVVLGNSAAVQAGLLSIGSVFLAPICEELFFRGWLQPVYGQVFGRRQGWALAGWLFGAVHLLAGLTHLLPACLLGLALGWATLVTDSVWAAVALHFGNNLLAEMLSAETLAAVGGLAWLALPLAVAVLAGLGRAPARCQAAVSPLPWRQLFELWLAVLLLLIVAGVEVCGRLG